MTDTAANIVYVSPSVHDVFGDGTDEAVGTFGFQFIHPDDIEVTRSSIGRMLADPDGFERVTFRMQDGSGHWRWVEAAITNCVSDPDILGLVINLRDITAEVTTQQELRRSEARYRAIAETAQEGILVVDAVGATLFANHKLADLLGLSIEDTYGTRLSALFDSSAAAFEARVVGHGTHGPEAYEITYAHPDGSSHVLSMSTASLALPMSDVGQLGTLAMISDVTDARSAENELRRRVLHDRLTDLPNRVLLTDRLHVALERQSRASSGPVALILFDLDQFKLVNDAHGHDAADLLLIESGTDFRTRSGPVTRWPVSVATSSRFCARTPTNARRGRSRPVCRSRWPAPSKSATGGRTSTRVSESPCRHRTTSTLCCDSPARPCTPPSPRAAATCVCSTRRSRPAPTAGCS